VSLGRIVTELTNKGLLDSTLIVISAKHGQSPIDIANQHMETGGKGTADVTDPHAAVNTIAPTVDVTLSTFTNPNSGSGYAINGHLMTDDVGILWLQDQTKTATAVTALQTAATAIHADTLPAGTVFSTNITSGAALAAIFGDPTVTSDPVASARAPNAFIQPNLGVIYSTSSKKIAEHGGGSQNDTGVALLVSLPAFGSAKTVSTAVATAQVAPTILQALGITPTQLQAVVKENTQVLPSLF
jgi:arylsulfatase A-like enzyme